MLELLSCSTEAKELDIRVASLPESSKARAIASMMPLEMITRTKGERYEGRVFLKWVVPRPTNRCAQVSQVEPLPLVTLLLVTNAS